MEKREPMRRWLRGWADLVHRDEIPGYRSLIPLQRLRLDLLVICDAARSPGTWAAVLICVAIGLATLVIAWELDLRGWRRDSVQSIAVLVAAPWVAAGRRRLIEQRLSHGVAKALNCITDEVAQSRDIAPGHGSERRRWRRHPSIRNSRCAGRASAGWISSCRSPAWGCWRRWRCRGNGT